MELSSIGRYIRSIGADGVVERALHASPALALCSVSPEIQLYTDEFMLYNSP